MSTEMPAIVHTGSQGFSYGYKGGWYTLYLSSPIRQGQDVSLFPCRKSEASISRDHQCHFLRFRRGFSAMPGNQRVRAKSSHRNGPSTTLPSSCPQSLHSSHGNHGSSDCTCTDWMRLRKDQGSCCRSAGSNEVKRLAPVAACHCWAMAFSLLLFMSISQVALKHKRSKMKCKRDEVQTPKSKSVLCTWWQLRSHWAIS